MIDSNDVILSITYALDNFSLKKIMLMSPLDGDKSTPQNLIGFEPPKLVGKNLWTVYYVRRGTFNGNILLLN